MKKIIMVLAFVLTLLILSFIGQAKSSKSTPFDDTDDLVNKKRSGLTLYIDFGTGCQYLKAPGFFGGLTPRLNDEGKPLCNKVQQAKKMLNN